jgi:hypothetical protein
MSNKVVSPARRPGALRTSRLSKCVTATLGDRALDSDEQCGEYSPRAHGDERPQRPALLVAEH